MKVQYLSGGGLLPQSTPALLITQRGGAAVAAGDAAASHGTRVEGRDHSEDGVYAEWSWDGARLRAAVDRFGFQPLYVYSKGPDVGVSTSLAALIELGADRELDHGAIGLALRLGQFIGDDTPFRYIRTLAPGGTLLWQDGHPDVTGDYEIVSQAVAMSRDEAIDAYIAAFRAAILRRKPIDANFAVPLSGGRDSRHILFELVENRLNPSFCLTYVTDPEDMKVAGEICRRLKLRHVTVQEPPDPFTAEVQKNWATNFCVDEGAYPIAIAEALAANGANTVYDGIAGDVLSAGLFLSQERLDFYRSGRLQDFAEQLIGSTAESIIQKVLAPDFYSLCPREAAVERLMAELRRHASAHNPVTSYFFWNRTRRKIAQTPYGMFAGLDRVHSPYIDHEVFDLLMALPASLVLDHSLHTDAIVRAYPTLADIPFESKGGCQFDREMMYARFARRFAQEALLRPMPPQLNKWSLRARLGVGSTAVSLGAAQQWYLRQALWVHQLFSLA